MYKISVILPFSGSCPFLDRAVRSVLNDGFGDLELLLINNLGDTEATQLALIWQENDPRVRIVHETKPGISHALNAGIQASSTPYIARMDADDVSLPGRFFAQFQHLERHPETGLVSGLVCYAGHRDQAGYHLYVDQINRIVTSEQIRLYRFIESPLAHPSVMFRKSLIVNYGFYSTDPVPEDYDLWLRWLDQEVKMDKVDIPVLEWTDHPERLSRNSIACSKEAFDKVRMHYFIKELQRTFPDGESFRIWGAGKLARKKAEALLNAGYSISGFIDVDPSLQEATLAGKSLPVTWYHNIPPAGGDKIISMVSNRGRPFEIEAFLLQRGYRTGTDLWLLG